MSSVKKMVRRQKATDKTLARFGERAFDMEAGVDCGQLALFHLRSLGIKIPKNKLNKYKTPIQARTALKEAYGVNNLPAVLDQYLERIPVAAAILGDIIQLPAAHDKETKLGALGIYMGQQIVAMFDEDSGLLANGRMTFDPDAPPLAAWRAIK